MKVKDLILALQKQPSEAEVYKVSYDGCEECNAEGLPWYHAVDEVEFKETGDYPNVATKNVVVL